MGAATVTVVVVQPTQTTVGLIVVVVLSQRVQESAQGRNAYRVTHQTVASSCSMECVHTPALCLMAPRDTAEVVQPILKMVGSIVGSVLELNSNCMTLQII